MNTLTLRSTSSRLTFSFLALKGACPSIISYKRQPKENQSGENAYLSLSITSGAEINFRFNTKLF